MAWPASRLAALVLAFGAGGAAGATTTEVMAALAPPEGAEITHEDAREPGLYRAPVRPFGAEGGVTEPAEGRVVERAFRLSGGTTPLALARRYQARLAALGFETVLDCDTDACGGFDFRFAIPVLDQPAMAVSLGDFHQLTMRRRDGPGPSLVSLLVSRFGDRTLAQLVLVTNARPPRAADGEPQPAGPDPAPAPRPAADTAEASGDAAEPAARDALADKLLSRGAAPLDGLDFVPGSTTFAPGSEHLLDRAAAALKVLPDRDVAVVGHTDATGSLALNIRVSRQRAQAVLDALAARGVARGRMVAEGAGWLAPRAPNDTESGRARNRRVELVLR